MNIIKRSKYFILLLFVTLGAIFLAPKAYAADEIPSDVLSTVDKIKEYLSTQNVQVTGELGVDYHVFWLTMQDAYGRDYYSVTLFNSPDFTFDWYESGNSYGIFNVTSDVHWCYYTRYFDPTYSLNSPSRTYIGIPYPKEIHGTFPVEWITNAKAYSNDLQYGAISSVQNIDFTHIKPILTDYLVNKGWVVSGAYLADDSLSQIQALNVATSYQDLPSDFVGLYCLQERSANYYKFSVAITPTANPNDYSKFWDSYLVVVFNSSPLTNVTCYFGSEYSQSPHPLALKIGDANWNTDVNTSPMVISSKAFRGTAIGTGFSESQSPQIRVAIRWRFQSMAAISLPQISPLYVAFDYSNEVGGSTSDGNGSSNYSDYETNYYNTTYQQVINGFSGSYTGQNGLSDTFSKPERLELAEPKYNGDYDLTYDGNFLYLFEKLMHLEFVSKMLLGVFSISIAIYIIFGSSY